MFNQSEDAVFAVTSNTPPPLPSNSTWDPTDKIDANDLTSRANYVYSFLAALGLASACFLLYSFVLTYRAQRPLAWLDRLLWLFCGAQLLLLLLSLSLVVHIPDHLITARVGCAALSFAVSTVSHCGLLLLVLMAYVLSVDPPFHTLMRKPGLCVAMVTATLVLFSLSLAIVRGPRSDLGGRGECYIDLMQTHMPYAATKLCLTLLLFAAILKFLIRGCVRQWKSEGRFLSGSEEGPVFLAVSTVMFACHLVYTAMLVRAAHLARAGALSTHERAVLSVGEFVMFSGSALSLLLVLLMHRPSRESLQGLLRQLRDCCRNSGRTQAHRNIIAPHIEITDTLQDIEL
ncbi:uncharacterized protein LOC143015619 [Genypterus blacodes]|uniref:uncharacterized protein LOC143015619 n=1 Tax=Genypterus blacodes TaxID=154954 RepID=UPI003F76E89A